MRPRKGQSSFESIRDVLAPFDGDSLVAIGACKVSVKCAHGRSRHRRPHLVVIVAADEQISHACKFLRSLYMSNNSSSFFSASMHQDPRILSVRNLIVCLLASYPDVSRQLPSVIVIAARVPTPSNAEQMYTSVHLQVNYLRKHPR